MSSKNSYLLKIDGRAFGYTYERMEGHTVIRTDSNCIVGLRQKFLDKIFVFYRNIRLFGLISSKLTDIWYKKLAGYPVSNPSLDAI